MANVLALGLPVYWQAFSFQKNLLPMIALRMMIGPLQKKLYLLSPTNFLLTLLQIFPPYCFGHAFCCPTDDANWTTERPPYHQSCYDWSCFPAQSLSHYVHFRRMSVRTGHRIRAWWLRTWLFSGFLGEH